LDFGGERYDPNKRDRCGRILLVQIGDLLAVSAHEAIFLGFSSERRCVRGLEAVVGRLLKFIDEGAELKEGRYLIWR